MKTKLFLLTLLLGCTLFVSAQDETSSATAEKQPFFWYGLKFGGDISSGTTTVDGIKSQLNNGYQAGILFQFGRKLYFQPELYYASYKNTTDGGATVNYIKAPLMVGLKFLDLGLFSLHLTGGPTYIKQLTSGDNNYTSGGAFKWQVGAGVDILGFITTDLRYQLNNKAIADQIQDFKTNGGTLNLTFGLKLR